MIMRRLFLVLAMISLPILVSATEQISQKGSHVKMKHDTKPGLIIFPNHGSQEVGN